MIRIKNVRPGILILADANLKLAPGEMADVETPTVHIQQCLDNGLLAQIEIESDTKTKSKNTSRSDSKKNTSQSVQSDMPPASDNSASVQTSDGGQGQLIEADNAGS